MEETVTTYQFTQEDFDSFIKGFQENNSLPEGHLIIVLQSDAKLSKAELSVLKKVARKLQREKKSFVLVNTALTYDEVGEGLNVCPTLQEARDLIEMENIERDLWT